MNRVKILFKKQDLWVGGYWDKYNIWICIIPCFPIWIRRSDKCRTCGQYETEGRTCSCKTEDHNPANTCPDCGECKVGT